MALLLLVMMHAYKVKLGYNEQIFRTNWSFYYTNWPGYNEQKWPVSSSSLWPSIYFSHLTFSLLCETLFYNFDWLFYPSKRVLIICKCGNIAPKFAQLSFLEALKSQDGEGGQSRAFEWLKRWDQTQTTTREGSGRNLH